MTATPLTGKDIAASIRAETSASVENARQFGLDPTLGVVIATDDDSTAWYVRSIKAAAEKVGLAIRISDVGATATKDDISHTLEELAADPTVHGIVLQTPLPAGVDLIDLAGLIPPEKDIDGANPFSAGRVMAGSPIFVPATAAAVMELLDQFAIPLKGCRAVVLGRSMVIGKPVAHLLLARDATVTICHSKTQGLASVSREANVLVTAIGRPRFVTAEFVQPGATVVDVGTTPDEHGKLVGDVDSESVAPLAGALTPVPGGVGPVTTAVLLRNAAAAATRLLGSAVTP